MNDCLYVSPLAEITTIGADKIALSVVGRRSTVEDKTGMLRIILTLARDGVSRAALVEKMADSFSAEVVDAALKALLDTKVLVRYNGRASEDATHEHLNHRRESEGLIMQGQSAVYEHANWLVALAGAGACSDALAASFAELDVAVLRLGENAALPTAAKRVLLIVCADYEDYALFRTMNAKAVEAGIPSLYVGVDWSTVQCGPLVIPRATACYECYFHRVRCTRKFVAEFDVRSQPDAILYHAIPSKLALRFGVAEASRVALQYLAGTLENLQHSVFSEIDSLSGEVRRSRILRLPRCATCGNASSARPVGSVFQQALLRRRA